MNRGCNEEGEIPRSPDNGRTAPDLWGDTVRALPPRRVAVAPQGAAGALARLVRAEGPLLLRPPLRRVFHARGGSGTIREARRTCAAMSPFHPLGRLRFCQVQRISCSCGLHCMGSRSGEQSRCATRPLCGVMARERHGRRSHALTRLAVHQRRQALFRMHREAAGLIDAEIASVWPRTPRTPRPQKLPPEMGKTARTRGFPHSFSLIREAGRAAKPPNPWMRTIWGGALSGSTVRSAAFAICPHPRKCSIYPRVGLFFPRVQFPGFGPLSLSISLFFIEREEGKEGAGARKPRSTGCICKPGIQNLRVVEKTPVSTQFRGWAGVSLFNEINDLACSRGSIHGSTGEMPLYPRAAAHFGGVCGSK